MTVRNKIQDTNYKQTSNIKSQYTNGWELSIGHWNLFGACPDSFTSYGMLIAIGISWLLYLYLIPYTLHPQPSSFNPQPYRFPLAESIGFGWGRGEYEKRGRKLCFTFIQNYFEYTSKTIFGIL
jgi:hypothetical protein